jgi:pseudouridine-5'-phosphate glycosidase
MSKDQIQELAEESNQPNNKLIKVSRRDLPYALANTMSGGTTVAATMMLAHKASWKLKLFLVYTTSTLVIILVNAPFS